MDSGSTGITPPGGFWRKDASSHRLHSRFSSGPSLKSKKKQVAINIHAIVSSTQYSQNTIILT